MTEIAITSDQFWFVILLATSVLLLIVSFFRTNIFISLACIMSSVGLMLIPVDDKPKWIFYVAGLLILAEIFKVITVVFLGKKASKKRYTG